jgi:hypothetical protein|tara:strand:- start:234 stop:425 length:192 start_codon:yes stop_codon:yes gene_type:complete
MNDIINFAKERVGSLVSKKVGAAVLAEGAAIGTEHQGLPLIIYIVMQGIVDAAKAYAEATHED